jgi:hypothetical protein
VKSKSRFTIHDLRNENSGSDEWRIHPRPQQFRTIAEPLVSRCNCGSTSRINADENDPPYPLLFLDDVYDARRVAEELGFPFTLNLERDFERDVVQPSSIAT